MKRILFLFFVALVTCAFATSAALADATGLYVGAAVGGGTGHTDWTYTSGSKADHHISGVIGGMYAGYNQQFASNMVLGLETEINGTSISGKKPCPNPTFSCNSKIPWLGSTRLRAGWALGSFLPYVSGGVAYDGVRLTTHKGGNEFGATKSRVGWTVGPGIEFAVTDQISTRFEYAYYRTDHGTSTVDNGLRVRNQESIHTFRVGASYKFWTP